MDYSNFWDWNWSGSGPKTLDDAFELVKVMKLDLHMLCIGGPLDDAVSDVRPRPPAQRETTASSFVVLPFSPNSDRIELFDHDRLVQVAEDIDEECDGLRICRTCAYCTSPPSPSTEASSTLYHVRPSAQREKQEVPDDPLHGHEQRAHDGALFDEASGKGGHGKGWVRAVEDDESL